MSLETSSSMQLASMVTAQIVTEKFVLLCPSTNAARLWKATVVVLHLRARLYVAMSCIPTHKFHGKTQLLITNSPMDP